MRRIKDYIDKKIDRYLPGDLAAQYIHNTNFTYPVYPQMDQFQNMNKLNQINYDGLWKVFVEMKTSMNITNYYIKIEVNPINKLNCGAKKALMNNLKAEIHKQITNLISTHGVALNSNYNVEMISSNDAYISNSDLRPMISEIQKYIKNILSNPNTYYTNLNEQHTSTSNIANIYQEATRLIQQERFEQAIQILDSALLINPNDPEIHFDKGYALSQLGRYNEAIQSYDHVIALDPSHYLAYNDKGFAYECMKDFNEAYKWYQLALEKNPDSEVVRNNLSNMQTVLDKQNHPPAPSPNTTTGQYDVMISYSWKDQKQAFNLYNLLTNQGFKCWIDKNEICAGSVLYDELMNAVLQSKVILLCISKSYLQSDNCYREFFFAQQNKSKESIVPIKFGDFENWPPNHKIFFLLADTVRIENIYEQFLNPVNTTSNEITEFIQQLRWKLNNNNNFT